MSASVVFFPPRFSTSSPHQTFLPRFSQSADAAYYGHGILLEFFADFSYSYVFLAA